MSTEEWKVGFRGRVEEIRLRELTRGVNYISFYPKEKPIYRLLGPEEDIAYTLLFPEEDTAYALRCLIALCWRESEDPLTEQSIGYVYAREWELVHNDVSFSYRHIVRRPMSQDAGPVQRGHYNITSGVFEVLTP